MRTPYPPAPTYQETPMSRVMALSLILALAPVGSALAAPGTVTGTVTSSATSAPIAGVSLTLCNTIDCWYADTDAAGLYTISAEPGTYVLYTQNSAGFIN